ncbi:hypothetical protein ACIBF7_03005 [Nonomuraea sp. NPDC050478]|uniref:hypothetical protein n=1 Tax=Nonomuraea sp. NPDC050478 TaxID=3364365 RepID=UPI0037989F60
MRFDDQFPIQRPVSALSDAAFRMHVTAIFWSARIGTNGAILQEDLVDMCPRVRKPQRFVTELASRGIWHEAGQDCPSARCPAPVEDGWAIHDFFSMVSSEEQAAAERKGNAERQRKYRARQRNRTVPPPVDGGSSAERNALLTSPGIAHSRKRTRTDQNSQSSSRLSASSWAEDDESIDRGIVQLLSELTGHEITLADAAGVRHAILDGRSVKHRSRYVATAIEDNPSKFVPVLDGGVVTTLEKAAPDWCGYCDERTRLLDLPDDTVARCPACHPLAARRPAP